MSSFFTLNPSDSPLGILYVGREKLNIAKGKGDTEKNDGVVSMFGGDFGVKE